MQALDGFEFAARTDTGLVRAQNEDVVVVEPAYHFAVLADGMGGYNAGEVASHIAAQVAAKTLKDGLEALRIEGSHQTQHLQQSLHKLVVDAFRRANGAVLDAACSDPRYNGMGTTLIATVFRPGVVSIAHSGDSRAYRLRDGELLSLTRDHSVLQGQIDAGLIAQEWAPYAPHRNLLTRAIGIAGEVEVELHDFTTQDGDLYMLCSDGLSDMLLDRQLAHLLMQAYTSLDGACERLVEAANSNGGHDNISVILIKLPVPLTPLPRGIVSRMFSWAKQARL